jgi:hypothetical protein
VPVPVPLPVIVLVPVTVPLPVIVPGLVGPIGAVAVPDDRAVRQHVHVLGAFTFDGRLVSFGASAYAAHVTTPPFP